MHKSWIFDITLIQKNVNYIPTIIWTELNGISGGSQTIVAVRQFTTESLSKSWALLCEQRGRAGVNIELMIGTKDDIDRCRHTVKRGLKVGPGETLPQVLL